MNRLQHLMDQIKELEQELVQEIQKKEQDFAYKLKGRKVRFVEATLKYHKTMVTSVRTYLAQSSILNILTAPFIWACLLPALFMDAIVSLYQFICFPVYGIPKVKRRLYIAIDRHSLGYLNWIEKVNCVYCGYFNGLIAYVQEIAARTEQYWCPIKHARKLNSIHTRYHKFLDYGDADNYAGRLEQIRKDFADLKNTEQAAK